MISRNVLTHSHNYVKYLHMYDIKFIFKAKKLDRGIDKYQVYEYFFH